ncbi:hypothetical protein QQP08_011665 [Theobroma cacao]|nr:hypothetical protein QQP08_011665 [Theobroma cacao]
MERCKLVRQIHVCEGKLESPKFIGLPAAKPLLRSWIMRFYHLLVGSAPTTAAENPCFLPSSYPLRRPAPPLFGVLSLIRKSHITTTNSSSLWIEFLEHLFTNFNGRANLSVNILHHLSNLSSAKRVASIKASVAHNFRNNKLTQLAQFGTITSPRDVKVHHTCRLWLLQALHDLASELEFDNGAIDLREFDNVSMKIRLDERKVS